MWRRRTKNFQFSARRVGARQKGENNLFFLSTFQSSCAFSFLPPPPPPRVLCELFMKARVEKGREGFAISPFSPAGGFLTRRPSPSSNSGDRRCVRQPLSSSDQRKEKRCRQKKREEKEKVSCFQDTTQFPQPSFPSSSSKQACPNSGFAQQLRLYRLMGWRLDASSPAFKCYRLKCVQVRAASLFCFDLDAAAQKKSFSGHYKADQDPPH